MDKALVAYFSATGTTERAAKSLADATGADLFEIAAAEPYTAADLNWNNSSSRSSVEMNDETARPAIAQLIDGLDDYDTVFVGFPVWWYIEPRIIDTFLESYDFSAKTIIPFATSGGSGLGEAPDRMAMLCPRATVKRGGLLNNPSPAAIERFITANVE